MQLASSIQLPKRLDPKRKQLVKQLENDIRNIKNQIVSTPKRSSVQGNQDFIHFDTLKKKPHLDTETIRNGKQKHFSQKQNDKLFAHNKNFDIPIKPQINSRSVNQTRDQNDNTVRKDENFHLPKIPVLFPIMLDQHIPNLRDANLGIFTDKERLLISIQQKLDSFLLFVKENRKKKKGEFFSAIKKSFLQNQRIFLEFSHVKKILFVDSELYKVQKIGQGFSIDCLIDIKLKCNEFDAKEMEKELKERRNTFPKKLLAVKEELKNISEEDEPQIPEVKFEFEAKIEETKNVMRSSLKNILDGQMMNKKKIDKYFVLQNKDSQEYQMAKKILLTGIKRVETIIKKETEIDLTLFEKKMMQDKQLSQKEIESIIEEVNFIYRSKGVTNMLFDVLIEALSKRLIMSLNVLKKCIEIFIEVGGKINKGRPMLRAISHRTGRIVQIERSSIEEFRREIVKSEEWMGRFKFELELTTEEVRKKMEEERLKVFEEVKETVVEEVVESKQEAKEERKVKSAPKVKATEPRKLLKMLVRAFQVTADSQRDQNSKEYSPEQSGSEDKENKPEEEEDLSIIGLSKEQRKVLRLERRKEREDDLKAIKQIKEDMEKREKKLQELLKHVEEKKKKQHQIKQKKEHNQSQEKEEWNSTLSNSDQIFQEIQPLKNSKLQ